MNRASGADDWPGGGTTVLVLAKEPRPGHSKTRLAPRFGDRGAADLAAAALADTLDVVRRADVARRVLVLDGSAAAVAERFGCDDLEIVPQVDGDHGKRIVAALELARGPAVLVGMDTPQLRPLDLELDLTEPADAWLGPAEDGGWWLLGLRNPRRDARTVLGGVPMSTPHTCADTLAGLQACGLTTRLVRRLRDVDEPDDAPAVAGRVPSGRFAACLAHLTAAAAVTAPAASG